MQRSVFCSRNWFALPHCVVAWLLALAAILANDAHAQPPTESKPITVLFDTWHSNTWLRHLPTPQQYDYHQLSSLARAAHSLEALGWVCEPQVEPWTEETLKDVPLVVINLVSADRPGFLLSEIKALNQYLEAGGGIIVITDHTNCYFHNTILGPWFNELGIALSNHSACDVAPYTIAQGNVWISIESFAKHPVVEQLNQIAFQTGGSVDPKFAIAWTSPQGWHDEGQMNPYGEGKSLGFFGDFSFELRETPGPVSVIAAKEIGKGRMVIIGDQNCVGSSFINYADNRKLWLQAALWTSHQSANPADSELLKLGLAGEKGRTLAWCYEPLSKHQYFWGSDGVFGLHNAFDFLNKHADARATDRFQENAAWFILPTVELLEDPNVAAASEKFAKLGERKIMILGDEGQRQHLESWLQPLNAEPLNPPTRGVAASWQIPGGSQVFWVDQRNEWLNTNVPASTILRSEKEEKQDQKKLEWMWENGLIRVGSERDKIPWDAE